MLFLPQQQRRSYFVYYFAVGGNLLSVLSGYGEEPVVEHFKRNLTTGMRKGHKVSIIASDVKDFAFLYKQNQGKLVISFNFGEWNASGFPQHC